jgi:hypothetical protein
MDLIQVITMEVQISIKNKGGGEKELKLIKKVVPKTPLVS